MVNIIDVHDLPEEQAKLVQEFVDFLRKKMGAEKPKKKKVKETVKVTLHPIKADVFLRHPGIISVGGDAVEEAKRYDE